MIGNGPTCLTGGLRYLLVLASSSDGVITLLSGALHSTRLYFMEPREDGTGALRNTALHPVTRDSWFTMDRTVGYMSAGASTLPPMSRLGTPPSLPSFIVNPVISGELPASFDPFAKAFESPSISAISAVWVSDNGNTSRHNMLRFTAA